MTSRKEGFPPLLLALWLKNHSTSFEKKRANRRAAERVGRLSAKTAELSNQLAYSWGPWVVGQGRRELPSLHSLLSLSLTGISSPTLLLNLKLRVWHSMGLSEIERRWSPSPKTKIFQCSVLCVPHKLTAKSRDWKSQLRANGGPKWNVGEGSRARMGQWDPSVTDCPVFSILLRVSQLRLCQLSSYL